MATDHQWSTSQPLSGSQAPVSRNSTRYSHSSRTHRKSLKTFTGAPVYPERPGAQVFSLAVRLLQCSPYAMRGGIFGKGSIPQVAGLAAHMLRLFSRAPRRQARNSSRLLRGRSFRSDMKPSFTMGFRAFCVPVLLTGKPPRKLLLFHVVTSSPIRPRKRFY